MAKAKNPNIPTKAFDEYKKSPTGFPSDEISPEKKATDKSWSLAHCKAIFSKYVHNQTALGYSDYSRIYVNRSYGRGIQDISKYRHQLRDIEDDNGHDSGRGTESSRKGDLNINWDTVSQIPKLKRVIQGMVDGTIFDATTTAIDPTSGLEKEEAMWRMWFEAQTAEKENELQELSGGTADRERYYPESLEELRMIREMGGIRTETEVGFDKILKAVFYESKYDKKIQPLLVEDLFENNMMAVKEVTNPQTHRVEQEYVDIARMIAPYDRRSQYDDMPYCAITKDVNITEVAAETGLTQEYLRSIGQAYNGWNDNGDINDMLTDVNYLDMGIAAYAPAFNDKAQNYKCVVAEVEWHSVNGKAYLRKTDRNGDQRFIEKKGKGNESIQYVTVYKCKWLVGTDVVWDIGPAENIGFDKRKRKPTLSTHVVRLTGKSMVELLIPAADMYSINWYKLQNALAMAPPAGLAFEWQALQNMMVGGKKLKPKDLMKLRMQTGNVPYKSTSIIGKPNAPHGIPFKELEGGIGRQFNEFMALFELFEGLQQRFTGITDVAAAQTPNPNAPVGTTEMSYQATINALRPMFNALALLKQMSAESIIRKIQVIAKWDKKGYEAYLPSMGAGSLEAIKITSSYSAAVMGIHVEIRNDAETKMAMEQALANAMKPTKDGTPGLTTAQYMFIKRMMANNNLKLAELWLNNLESKAQRRAEDNQRKNAEAQGAEAQKLQAMKNEGEQKKMDKEHRYKMEEIALEGAVTQQAEVTKGEMNSINAVINGILQEYAARQQEQQQAQPPVLNQNVA